MTHSKLLNLMLVMALVTAVINAVITAVCAVIFLEDIIHNVCQSLGGARRRNDFITNGSGPRHFDADLKEVHVSI